MKDIDPKLLQAIKDSGRTEQEVNHILAMIDESIEAAKNNFKVSGERMDRLFLSLLKKYRTR